MNPIREARLKPARIVRLSDDHQLKLVADGGSQLKLTAAARFHQGLR